MQLTVGPRGQNFRGSGKWRLCVRPNDRQTFLLLGAVKNLISVGLGYLLDPLAKDLWLSLIKSKVGKHFCSFLFMLNFGNQFPFRILFRILSVIVVNCNLIISVMAAWPIKSGLFNDPITAILDVFRKSNIYGPKEEKNQNYQNMRFANIYRWYYVM